MKNSETILVCGASGQQGGSVMRSLLRQGQKVLALTRDSSKREGLKSLGADVVIGDLTDRSSLEKAFQGIKKVYLVTTPMEKGLESEVAQGFAVADVAKAAGVDHLVFSSVAGADKHTGIPHFETKWKVEQYIKSLGIPATVIRPVFFMENFASPWVLPSIQKGKLALPLKPDCRLHMVSVKDIGEFVAAAFLHPQEFIGQTIELAGDELTMIEALDIISKSRGHKIQYELIPDEQMESSVGHDMALMYRWFNEVGYQVNIPALQTRWKIPLTKFKDLNATPILRKAA
jgi:uncharacterized protein YbjT (DUF2867 family)